MNLEKVSAGLSERARDFVRSHGTRVDCSPVGERRERWLSHGIPVEQVDRAAAFQERWGGLRLPLPPVSEGPVYLNADVPEGRATKISLAAYDPVPEVKGMADTWWRGENSLVAIYTGDARAFSMPGDCRTFVYSGL